MSNEQCSPSIGNSNEASTADVGPYKCEPVASDVVKALETAMLQKQDVDSVTLMQLINFVIC